MTLPTLFSARPRVKRLGGAPSRIAFLVDWLEDPYQEAVLAGAVAEAKQRGVGLVALAGGIVGGKGKNGQHRNHLFSLVQPGSFDAAIVMTGTLGNHGGPAAVSALCRRFEPIPVASIAVKLPGLSAVLVDNASGMKKAIEHLVRDHGRRKVAFIRGPDANAEAEARYGAYLAVLEENGVPLDPDLVLPGDFQREGGVRAIATLFDKRRVSHDRVDAVAAATDLMVMGAIDELGRRGLRVPADVAVVGFDDVEEARYLSPPLTSVRQSLEEQGAVAVRTVLAQLNGTEVVHDRVLDTVFVKRRSCGCLPEESPATLDPTGSTSRLTLGAGLIRQRALLLAEVTRAARGSFVGVERGWEERLFSGLLDEFGSEERNQAEPFRRAFDRVLGQVLEGGGDVAIGNDVVSALRKQLAICAGDDVQKLRRVETLMHDARILTSSLVERSQARDRLRAQRWGRLLGDVCAELVSAVTMADLRLRIATQIPRLGIDLCLVLRTLADQPDSVRLEAAWVRDAERSRQVQLGAVCLAAELAPGELLGRETPQLLVVEPLGRDGEQWGFAVFGYAPISGYTYEMLRELISASIWCHPEPTRLIIG